MKGNKKGIYYWSFLTPILIALTSVVFMPFFYGVYYSFTDYDGFSPAEFIGFENYVSLWTDSQFLQSLWFTVRFSVISVLLINIIGLALALLVTQKMGKLSTFFRTVYFMPNLIGGVILGFIWQFVFVQAFEGVAENTGIELFHGWLSNQETGFWGLVIVFVWQMSGYIMVIYISFLNGIPKDLIEAGKIDGASSWQTFRNIKFPMLAPAFTISLFLTISNAFMVYDLNLALTGGGPYGSTQMIAMNIYNTAFNTFNQGYAQSKAIVFTLIVALITTFQIYFTRKREIDL